jgi:hypothetical protein
MKKSNVSQLLVSPVFITGFLLLVFSIVAANPYISYDEALWTYIGRLWNAYGIPPYVGVVENKTPGIFILFAISDFFTSGSFYFVRAVGVLTSILTAIVLYGICKKLYNNIAGVICMYVFGLVLCWNVLDGFAFAQTETFMIFFSTLAFYLLIKSEAKSNNLKWLFFSGLSVGGAIAFKQIAVTTAFAFLVAFFVINNKASLKYKLKGVIVIGLGISIATFLSYFVLFFYGVSFYEYINEAWYILLNSGSKVNDVSVYFKGFLNVFLFSRFVVLYPLFLLFFFQKGIRLKKLYAVLLIWFLLDFIGVNASGYYYGHQIKQLLPPLTIIISIGIAHWLSGRYASEKQHFKKKLEICVVFIGIILFPYKQVYLNYKRNKNFDESSIVYVEAGNWIRSNTNKADYIYILGAEPNLVKTLSVSERITSSKYFNSIFIANDFQRETIFKDLKQNPPKYILKYNNFNNELIPIYGSKFNFFMIDSYVLDKEIGNIEIFKLK